MAGATTESDIDSMRDDLTEPARLSDDQLLDRFVRGEEPASSEAFGVLVSRHGPMVLSVCRHVLGLPHDAEDAFQATFLVLARNAGSIRDRRVVSRWLYEVAYRVALRARSRATRRRLQEKEAAEMSAVAAWSETDPALCELRPVLHEEINRLPQTYRSAVVLCYLEGRTNEEAAALLRWPVGTVKGRLSRARDLLRSRLTRRGLVLSTALLLTWLTEGRGFAASVSPTLAEATTRAALGAAHEVTPEVQALAQGIDLPGRFAPLDLSLNWMRAGLVGALVAVGLVALHTAQAPAQNFVNDVFGAIYPAAPVEHRGCGEPLVPAPAGPSAPALPEKP